MVRYYGRSSYRCPFFFSVFFKLKFHCGTSGISFQSMSKISFQTPGNNSKFKRIHLELANPETNEEDIRLTGSRLDLDMIPESALKSILAELHEGASFFAEYEPTAHMC